MKNPKVSVQMCTFNRAKYIRQAIDSVLAQTYTNWELLIVDDASTDNTQEIIDSYLKDQRIRYIKNTQNLGINKNRNKALTLSTGQYVAVLDSDDYWTDINKLLNQVTFLDSNPDYALIGSNMYIVNEAGMTLKKIKYPQHNFIIKKFLLIKNFFCHSSVLYRKQVALNLGGYNESLPIWEDYDLWLKIGTKHKLSNLGTYTTAYRKHGQQSDAGKTNIGKTTQAYIIEQYKNIYSGYLLAKFIDIVRNKKNHAK